MACRGTGERAGLGAMMFDKSHRRRGMTSLDWAAVLVVCGGVLVAVRWWQWPTYVEMAALGERLAQRERVHDELVQVQATIDRIRSGTEALETKLVAYQAGVFASAGGGTHLQTISNMQESCGVYVEQIKPEPVRHDGRFDVAPYTIVARGQFPDLLHLVHELESRVQNSELVDVTIRATQGDNDTTLTLTIDFYSDPHPSNPSGVIEGESRQGGSTY